MSNKLEIVFYGNQTLRDAPQTENRFLAYSRIFPSQFDPTLTKKHTFCIPNLMNIGYFQLNFLKLLKFLPKPCYDKEQISRAGIPRFDNPIFNTSVSHLIQSISMSEQIGKLSANRRRRHLEIQVDILAGELYLEFSNWNLTHMRALGILIPEPYTEFRGRLI